MNKLTEEYAQFLNDLNDWMPWVVKRGEAPEHLKTEYPLLTLAESQQIVLEWQAAKPRLLEEDHSDNDVGC